MHWLIERWCKVQWDEKSTLTTPKGKTHTLSCSNELPYLTERQLEQVLEDLPAATVPGRSGKRAGTKVASVCIILGPTACAVRFPVGKDCQHEDAAEQGIESVVWVPRDPQDRCTKGLAAERAVPCAGRQRGLTKEGKDSTQESPASFWRYGARKR